MWGGRPRTAAPRPSDPGSTARSVFPGPDLERLAAAKCLVLAEGASDETAALLRREERGGFESVGELVFGLSCADHDPCSCGAAVAVNLLYNLLVAEPAVPWAVLPMMLNAFGVALVFPILTLAILDMYPRQRGSASSLQAFTSLVFNAILAGVLSPLLSGNPVWLAAGTVLFALLGWAIWHWEIRAGTRMPPGDPEYAAALEPTERL